MRQSELYFYRFILPNIYIYMIYRPELEAKDQYKL